jgi:hypothetical protein
MIKIVEKPEFYRSFSCLGPDRLSALYFQVIEPKMSLDDYEKLFANQFGWPKGVIYTQLIEEDYIYIIKYNAKKLDQETLIKFTENLDV